MPIRVPACHLYYASDLVEVRRHLVVSPVFLGPKGAVGSRTVVTLFFCCLVVCVFFLALRP